MRRTLLVRSLALGALAATLLFGPGLLPAGRSKKETVKVRSTITSSEKRAKLRPATIASSASASTETTGFIPESAGRRLEVALDELYFPDRPATARIATIPSQANLDALLAYAAAQPVPSARLILYPENGPRHVATRRILNPGLQVALDSAASPTPAPRPDLGIVAWERPAYAPGRAIARIAGDPAQPLRAAAALARSPGLSAVRPLLARQHARHLVPADPLFKDQWHLRNTGQQSGKSGVDIRAVPAWDIATGSGVTIGIVDDGIDYYHPDLSPAYHASLGYDWNDHDASPLPVFGGLEGDNHGTAVAGLAAARGDNHIGMAGAAPLASLAGLRLIAAPTDDEEDAQAMAWRNDIIAIKNNSWGPVGASPDDQISPGLYPAGELWQAAVADAVTTGRGGLGTLFFFSSGNGQTEGDQGPKNGYAGFRYVIPVGAVTNKGAVASFSEGGPHLVATAPGDASIGVATTDRPGDNGYNTSTEGYYGDYVSLIDYTRAFGGTSASAPIASGVAALLLELRPDLGWRDVKEIFLRSSTQLSATDPGWTKRAGNRPGLPAIHHHTRLGAGLINAQAALRLATAWPVLPPEEVLSAPPPATPLPVAIPDAPKKSPVKLTFVVPAEAQPFRIEHVSLTLGITHPARGDLDIQLRSPSGVVSRFATATLADSGADYPAWTFTSVRHWGEPAAGTWTLTVSDLYRQDTGTLDSANLVFHGIPLLPPALSSNLPQPADGTFTTGSTLLAQVHAEGLDLTYTWYRDDKKIAAGRSPDLRIQALAARDAGTYRCVVSNPWGSVSTPDFVVTIDDTPRATFTTHAGVLQQINLDGRVDVLGYDSPLKIAGLPPGLRFDRATRTITGVISKAGVWNTSFTIVYDGFAIREYIRFESAAHYPDYAGAYVATLEGGVPALNRGLGGLAEFLVRADGRFTGQLRLGTARYPLSGTFRNSEQEGIIFIRLTLPASGSVPSCRLYASIEQRRLEVTVGRPGDSDNLLYSEFSTPWNNRPLEPYETGRYLLELADTTPLPGGTLDGYADVAANGRITWRLRNSAGKALHTGSIMLNEHGQLRLYDFTTKPLGELVGSANIFGYYYTRDFLAWRPANPTTSGYSAETRDLFVTPPEVETP